MGGSRAPVGRRAKKKLGHFVHTAVTAHDIMYIPIASDTAIISLMITSINGRDSKHFSSAAKISLPPKER